MTTTARGTAHSERGFPRLMGRVSKLGRHRVLVILLVAAADRRRSHPRSRLPELPDRRLLPRACHPCGADPQWGETIVASLVCLALALYVIVIQDRWDGPTITVVCFSVLSGAALIALSYLFKQVDQLYETERSTTDMLESLAAQLQTLQEVVVLDSARPLSDLLGRVIDQASQLLGSDGCCVYRYDAEQEVLEVAAATGSCAEQRRTRPCRSGTTPSSRALADRAPVARPRGRGGRRASRRPASGAQRSLRCAGAHVPGRARVHRPGRASGGVVRRAGRAGDRERATAGRDRSGRGGHRALAAGARPARLSHAVAVRREPQGRGDPPSLAADLGRGARERGGRRAARARRAGGDA